MRQHASTRTTAGGSFAPSSSPSRDVATPARDRLWAGETRHPTLVFGLDVPRASSGAASRSAPARCSSAGWRRRWPGPGRRVSATARQVIGLREIAELPKQEALAAIVVRTRRYAAYQRKWMRRIPGLVLLDAERPPADIADEIVSIVQHRSTMTRKALAAIALAGALAFIAASCGGGDEAAGSSDGKVYEDAIVAAFREADDGEDSPIPEEDARCAAGRFVGVLGVDRLVEAGIAPEEIPQLGEPERGCPGSDHGGH